MTATTFAQGWTKTAKAMKTLNELFKAGGVTNSTNFVDLVQAYQLASQAEGDQAAQALGAFSSMRAAFASILRASRAALDPTLHLISRSSAVGSTEDSLVGKVDDITRYMATSNAESVTSRGIVRGAFSAGSPSVGNGTWKRVWVDAYGYPIEVGFAETYRLRCTADQGQGVPFKGREQFLLKGDPYVDELEWKTSGRGSGLNILINGVNGDDSLLRNPSFGDTAPNGDATPTSIPGWTVSGGLAGDGTDIIVDRTNYYQESQNENGSPAALKFKTSKTIYQRLRGSNSNNIPINAGFPYYAGIKIKADLSGQWTGTIAVTLGAKTFTKTISTETGWIDVDLTQLIDGTEQSSLWYHNWGTNDATFQIAVTKTSGGAEVLLVDRAMLLPYPAVRCPITGGVMFFLLGLSGSTPWKRLDTGTITDSEVANVVIQPWSHRAWGVSWPSRPAAPTASAPTVANSATAGSVTAGNHLVAIAFVNTEGVVSPIGTASAAVNADGSHKVDVSGIPTGGANIAKRRVYMTKAGETTPFYYTGSSNDINDNTATTKTIDVADGSLSTEAVTITIAEP